VNGKRQLRLNLRGMKTTTSILLLILLAVTCVAADQSTMRYNPSGELQLTMEQDIYPGGRSEPLAGRKFEMTITLSDAASEGSLHAELTAIKGNYNAHGMNQRLSVGHLAGQQVTLANDGLSISLEDPGPGLGLGPITDGDLYPLEILVDVLPTLPDEPVAPGMSWETQQAVRSLEGWAWAGGDMRYQHEVTGISDQDGHEVVHVRSHGQTTVTAAKGTQGFLGDGTLERRIEWSFSADTGKLLSLSMEQEGQGMNELPQGQVEVRQVTRVELHRTRGQDMTSGS
jgi:hypothetical protein